MSLSPNRRLSSTVCLRTSKFEIARAIRGEEGARLVDEAWLTPGVRDLVAIPLYLTALLKRAPGAQMPSTKEEVLRP